MFLMFFRALVLFFLCALGLDWVDLQARLALLRPEIDAVIYGRGWDLQARLALLRPEIDAVIYGRGWDLQARLALTLRINNH